MVQTKYDVPVRRTHKGNRICLYHFYFIYTEDNLRNLLLCTKQCRCQIFLRHSCLLPQSLNISTNKLVKPICIQIFFFVSRHL